MGKLTNKIRRSIATKLSLGIVLMAIPVFVICVGLFFVQSLYNLKKETDGRAASTLKTMELRKASFMSTVETATNSSDWLIKEFMQPDLLLELTRRVVMLNANVDGCSITLEPDVLPQAGRYFSAYSVRKGDSVVTVREGSYDYYEKIWYSTPKKMGRACWVGPYDDYNEGTLSAGEHITSYCKPLYDDNGKLLGVIATDLSAQRLTETVDEERAYAESKVNISRYYRLAGLIIVLILLGLLLILFFTRQIVGFAIRPVRELLVQTQRMAEGDYCQQIAYSKKGNVVSRLQNSFARMQSSLNQHISEIQQVNEETAKRNDELAHAKKLVEKAIHQKTAFVQDISHQIRTPLNIVMGFSQVLRDCGDEMPPEEVKQLTGLMNRNVKLLNRMVMMLLDSSDVGLSEEMKSLKEEHILVNKMARDCISNVYAQFPDSSIAFATSISDQFSLHTNKLYLVRSLLELLYNAAKYSDGKHIILRVAKIGKMLRFVVEDKGPGIDKAYMNQMFVPFTKVNNLSEGLGLGLSLTKRNAENLGGDLIIDTSYIEGCRIILDLPI
ncbi:MAG: histidine kinase [Prevotella sp.]|nr:histidine kinase [Prevotella sp.]